MSQHRPEQEDEIATHSEDEVTEPPLYKVLIHNDDYTTMEFVVEVLIHVFNKSAEEATRIMLNVHHQGVGVCGTFTYEVAETKVAAVTGMARENGFPLRCSMEQE